VTLVLHDWGSVLGFHWARRHPERVQAMAYMEAIVQPRRWEDLPKDRVQFFKDMRSDQGEHMVLDKNFFIEKLLPQLILRRLTDAEMEAYRRPVRGNCQSGVNRQTLWGSSRITVVGWPAASSPSCLSPPSRGPS
jgi:haloalkane dehalogenase